MYVFLISPMHDTCPANLIPLDFIIPLIFGKEHTIWSTSRCSFLQNPVTYRLSLYSPQHPILKYSVLNSTSLNVRNQISHPYKNQIPFTCVYVYVSVFRQGTRKKNISNKMVGSISYIQSTLNFCVNSILICYCSWKFELWHIFQLFIINFYAVFCAVCWWQMLTCTRKVKILCTQSCVLCYFVHYCLDLF